MDSPCQEDAPALDPVECGYLRAIDYAAARGNCDEAQELAAWLREYRALYKVGWQ